MAKVGSVALIAGSVAAIPFTGGTSSAGIGVGMMGLTAGSVAISTAELAILVGGGIALTGLLLGRKIHLKPNGEVIIC